jgi:general secretion pathway protein D
MKEKNFTLAREQFRVAVAYLPDTVVSGKAHDDAVDGFCESGVTLAAQKIAEGKYAEAEAVVRELLADQYNPNCSEAAQLLAHLQQPGYFNKTMGPKFIAKIGDVRALLVEADGYYASGRYDLAFNKYEQVLNLDPYNVAARRVRKDRQHQVSLRRTGYNETGHASSGRSRKGGSSQSAIRPGRRATRGRIPERHTTGTARITNKLNTIIIPRIEFRDASIREAIDFLRQQAAANDSSGEGRRGVDIVLRLAPLGQTSAPPVPVQAAAIPPVATVPAPPPPASGQEAPLGTAPLSAPPPIIAPAVVAAPAISPTDARITITLNQIPLGEALRYIASQAGLKVKIEPYAVSIIPISEQSADLLTKEYRVPPGFISSSVNVGASSLNAPARSATGGGVTGKDTQETTGGRLCFR